MNIYRRIIIAIMCMVLLVAGVGRARAALAKESVGINESTMSAYRLSSAGILPDHPLYKLKVLRDRLMLKLIFNPVKKVEYYLILSDQGYAAGMELAKKGKAALAAETVRRAEHFYTLLISDYKWTIWRHKNIPELLTDNIAEAGLAHQKALDELIQLSLEGNKKAFEEVLAFSKRNYQEIVTFVEREVKEPAMP